MRKRRDLAPNARYHVICRSNRRELTLEPYQIKELFIFIVGRAKKKFRFDLENFCVMGNHFHMIIKPLKDENLSEIMKWILGVFAINYNKKLGITGHFWGDRFKSRIIKTRTDFLNLFGYIDRNPVRAKLVKNPWDWLYGSIAFAQKGRWDFLKKPTKKILELYPYYELLI